MLGLSTALAFLSGGGTPVSGGAVTVPDTPYVPPENPIIEPEDPVEPVDPIEPPVAPIDPPTPPALPLTITSRWHPAFSTTTLDGTRITSATDLTGLADITAPAGAGPAAMTDALGQPFWRFEGESYLEIADTLTLTSREMSVFFVGRFHQVGIRSPILSLGQNASGDAPNTIRPALEVTVDANSVPLPRTYSYPRNTSYPDMAKMVAGSQMQVVGMVGRANAAGGSRLWMNTDRITVQQSYLVSDIAGAEIGRYAYSPGSSNSWGRFDLYEIIIMDSAVSDADGDTLVADLMATYGVVPITNQLVLEGDSIMRGTGAVTSGLCANMVLTDPGANLIGPDWRVFNVATSGATITKLIERRDATNGWITTPLPGENVMAFELGRNDLSAGGQTASTHYANVVDYLTTDVAGATSNILAQGWDVRVMANIASAASLEPEIDAYRALLRDPAFAIDTQGYAGQVSVINTDQIIDAGAPIFATSAQASNTTYYAGDNTHPSITGCALRVTGGDTPQNGIATGL